MKVQELTKTEFLKKVANYDAKRISLSKIMITALTTYLGILN